LDKWHNFTLETLSQQSDYCNDNDIAHL